MIKRARSAIEKSRVLLLSLLSFLLGLGGLIYVDYNLVHHDPNVEMLKWWHYGLFHLFALLGSVGFAGFALEAFSKQHLFDEFVDRITELFDGNLRVAESLSDEIRRKRVENSLKVYLGEQEGQAIYDAMVSKYLQRNSPFRNDVVYEVTVYDLLDDIEIIPGEDGFSLKRDDYYGLHVHWTFKRIYAGYHSVVCILVNEDQELKAWLRRPDCLYREVMSLENQDREKIKSLLVAKTIDPILQKFFELDVRIEGKSLGVEESVLQSGNKSVEINLRVPDEMSAEGMVEFEINLKGVLAKSARHHTFNLVEPSSNPHITFNYPAAAICNAVAETLFVSEAAFEPIIKNGDIDKINRRVEVSLPSGQHDDSWVFPNSGVIFFWDNKT